MTPTLTAAPDRQRLLLAAGEAALACADELPIGERTAYLHASYGLVVYAESVRRSVNVSAIADRASESVAPLGVARLAYQVRDTDRRRAFASIFDASASRLDELREAWGLEDE